MAYSSLSYVGEKDSNDDVPELAVSLLLEDEKTLFFMKKAEQEREEILKLGRAYINRISNVDQALRRNSIRIYNIRENPREDLNSIVLDILNRQLKLQVQSSDLLECKRIGVSSSLRPILVMFATYKTMLAVLERKKYLKGTTIGICEDLCLERVAVLKKANSLFGKENVWVEKGTIMVQLKNKVHQRFHSMTELDEFLKSRDDTAELSL